MIKISKRLTTVASFVLKEEKANLIDVGCDHALLDIYLLQNNDKLKIVASDNKEAPLENAKKNITKYSFLNKIEICLKDGIKNIDENIDTVVIAGMGAETIISILEEGHNELKNIKRLIISSNNKYGLIRKEINKMGYAINDEKIVYEDNKFYVVMEFVKKRQKYSKKELYFGPILLKNKDDDFYRYYHFIKSELEEVLNKLPQNHLKRNKIVKELELLNEEC